MSDRTADGEAGRDTDGEAGREADGEAGREADGEPDGEVDREAESTEAEANGIAARYEEADGERLLTFSTDGGDATIAQNVEGYAILKVRPGPTGDELERYYGFDMALDHAAELLGVPVHDLPIPDVAADMGM